jgi:quercetin dioxygenase-like cupin family protein
MNITHFRAVPTKNEITSRWAEEGFGCDLWVDPPGQIWPGFIHRGDEMLLVTKGRLVLETETDSPVTLEPGDQVMIPAGISHTVRNVGGTEARWLYGYRYLL